MQHVLYIARDPDLIPLAAVAITCRRGRLDTTSCRWALLLPDLPSGLFLHELAGTSEAQGESHRLALRLAAQEARASRRLISRGDFEPAPWSTLRRWLAADRITVETTTAVTAYLDESNEVRANRASEQLPLDLPW